MKKISLAVIAVCLAGCSSIPRHCLSGAAIATSAGAAGGYLLGTSTAKQRYHVDQVVTLTGEPINIFRPYKTGTLYKNREALAVGTGLAAGAIALSICAAD